MKVELTLDDGKTLAAEVAEGPRMYDVINDTNRAVTQDDVDRWLRMEVAFGKICSALEEVRRPK